MKGFDAYSTRYDKTTSKQPRFFYFIFLSYLSFALRQTRASMTPRRVRLRNIFRRDFPMKKIVALFLALIMIMGICAVASAEDWKFERGITIVCPWGLGGGADGTI